MRGGRGKEGQEKEGETNNRYTKRPMYIYCSALAPCGASEGEICNIFVIVVIIIFDSITAIRW